MQITGDYNQKLQVLIASKQAPDVFWMAERFAVYASAGAIEPLDTYLKASSVDLSTLYDPQLAQRYVFQGKTYGLPDRAGSMVLYYNKTLFDKAKVAYPTGSWTWADMRKAAEALTVRGSTGKASQWGLGIHWGWWAWTWAFIHQNGGHILDKDGRPEVVSPENIEALQFYQDLFYKNPVAPTPTEYSSLGLSGPDPLFAQGKVAMDLTGGWLMADLKAVPFEWDIAPVFRNKAPGTTPFGSALVLSTQSKNKEAAMKFILWMTSVAGQELIAKNKQDVPANKVAMKDVFPKVYKVSGRSPNLGVFFDSVSQFYDVPRTPYFGDLESAFSTAVQRLILSRKDPKQTLMDLQEELEVVFE